MRPKKRIVWILIAATISLAACDHSKPKTTVAASADNPDELNKQIVSALQGGRYQDAVALARRSNVPQAESDFAVGELILQGQTDAHAAQVPRETIEDGLRLLEASALSGHQQAISSLAATFRTGLLRGASDAFLLGPDAGLSQCWDSTKEQPRMAPSCVDQRRKH